MGDVILRHFDGNTTSTFWQYGFIDLELFYECVGTLPTTGRSSYTMKMHLGDEGLFSPKTATFLSLTESYQQRVRARDPCCLVSGLPVVRGDFSRFREAHVFRRAHDNDWVTKGYPSITDPAADSEVGGRYKIDSIQNLILLRSDLHDAWDNYKFAVNPDRRHVIIPFGPGYDDIAGKVLKLDHLANPDLRPLDDLFRDHFLQGVLRNMIGASEPTYDYEDALGGGMMDLSWSDI